MSTPHPHKHNQDFSLKKGDRVMIMEHPDSAGKIGTIVFCGAYQVKVRLHDENRETWAFQDTVEIA
jgi:hypothetical protein